MADSQATETGGGQSKILGSVKSGFVALFSLQLLSRALTFGLNVAIARTVDRNAYGVGSVQLQLICDTILVLSREGFRDACQRSDPGDWADPRKRSKLLNVAWLSIPLAATVGGIVFLVSGFFSEKNAEGNEQVEGYATASFMFIAAAGLEMLAEPLYILSHNLMLINIRVRVEMAALALKVLSTSLAVFLAPSAPLRAFGIGALSYGATILMGFVFYFSSSQHAIGVSQTLKTITGVSLWGAGGGLTGMRERVDVRVLWLVATMSGKALQKYFLEKGEMLVLLRLFSSDAWAMFAIVQNLASLAARLVFLPIEDMGQLAFSKLLSSNQLRSANSTLCLLTKLVVTVGSLAAAFGPAYSYSAIHLLYGSKWSSTSMPVVLSWYSLLLLCMALNGITEAFTHASATPSQMRTRGALLLPVTALYLSFASLLAPLLGVQALVMANCLNMLLRAALSLRHASALFAAAGLPPPSLPLANLAPRLPLASALLLCGAATFVLDYLYVGGCGAVLWLTERGMLRELRDIGKGRKEENGDDTDKNKDQ